MRHPWMVTLAAVVLTGGCAAFQSDPEAMTVYQQTRADIEGGARQASFEEPTDDGFQIADLSPDNIGTTVRKWTGNGPDAAISRQLFAEGQRLYRQAAATEDLNSRRAQFAVAAEKFSQASSRWPDSAMEQEGLYWAGQSYFFADQYPSANDQFERLLKKFPNSKHIDQIEARRFSIASYWLQLDEVSPQAFYEVNLSDEKRPWRDTYGNAVRILDRIRIDDPRGKLADDATLAAGNAYFRAGRYLKADEYYTDLIKTFPSSEHQFMAHYLGVQSKLRAYQGPDYAGTSLDDAEKLIRQMRKQFPHEASQKRDFLNRAYARVRFNKAEREWARASYHERRGEHRAARMFFDKLVRDFSDTPFAPKAQERLAALAGKPARPPQRLSWLVDAFPASDEQPLMTTVPTTRR